MPKVELINNKKDQVVGMGNIPVGKLAVVVKSPIPTYIGRLVMGLRNGDTVCLATGTSWDSWADNNECRILEPSEQVKITCDPSEVIPSTSLTTGQIAEAVDSAISELVGKTVMRVYGNSLVSLVDGKTFEAQESIKVKLLPEGREIVLDNME